MGNPPGPSPRTKASTAVGHIRTQPTHQQASSNPENTWATALATRSTMVLQPETQEPGAAHQWARTSPANTGLQPYPPASSETPCTAQPTTSGSSPNHQQCKASFGAPWSHSQLGQEPAEPTSQPRLNPGSPTLQPWAEPGSAHQLTVTSPRTCWGSAVSCLVTQPYEPEASSLPSGAGPGTNPARAGHICQLPTAVCPPQQKSPQQKPT